MYDTPQNRNTNDDQALTCNYLERDPVEAYNTDQGTESHLFYEAVIVIDLHNQIRRSFKREMPAIKNFGNLEMFLQEVNANYNRLETDNLDEELMDKLEGIQFEAGILFERIELTRRIIKKDIKYLRRNLRGIRNGATGVYSFSVKNVVSTIYRNLKLNNDMISRLKSKRAEYFSVQCYILSHSLQN